MLCCFSIHSNAQSVEENFADTTYDVMADTSMNYDDDEYANDTTATYEKTRTLYFNNVVNDTDAINIRFNANDSINKYKHEADFNYPIDEDRYKLIQEQNYHKTDTTVTSKKDIKDNYPKEKSSSSVFIAGSFLSILLWTVIIAFFVIVIWLYVKDNNINMFVKRAKKIDTIDEIDYNNIFEIDYNKQIENAVNAGNYNVAARLGFLKLLKQLSQKNIINYGIEKTNFEYQFQLINTKYYQSFNAAAICYDYAWYSGIIITANQYNQIVQQYKALESLI